MNINNLASYTGGNELKKVILIILTLCSLFIYSCDGSNDPGLMITPQDILTRPDPFNENTIYGTYKIKEFHYVNQYINRDFTSLNLEGRAVISKNRFMAAIFWEEPGIGKMHYDFDGTGRVGFDRDGILTWTRVSIEGDYVLIEGNNCVVKGEKINDVINDDVLSWFPWSENTPLNETMDSTWSGTYGESEGTLTRQGAGKDDTCTVDKYGIAVFQVDTMSAFYRFQLVCVNNTTGEKSLASISKPFTYGEGFSEGNWGGLSQPVRIDNETIEIYIRDISSGGTYSYLNGKIRMKKVFNVILVLNSAYSN